MRERARRIRYVAIGSNNEVSATLIELAEGLEAAAQLEANQRLRPEAAPEN